MGSRRPLFARVIAAALLAGCGGGNAASQLAKAPEYNPADQTKCGITKSQAKPLIVEWPSADRGELEAQARNRGLVVVRYQGCEMQVLDGCTTPVKYGYAPITRKRDHVAMRDADDLYANVPVGAARLEAKLQRTGELDVDMTMVGRWEAERRSVRVDELQGSCEGATHVVTALTVGAFTFTAGADATVGGGATLLGAGGGAESSSKRETLNADGDVTACEKATAGDRSPPDGCGALLRVEVVPLGEATGAKAANAPSPEKAAAAHVDCPAGSTWDGSKCAATMSVACPAGLHFEAGRGCAPDVVAAAAQPSLGPQVSPSVAPQGAGAAGGDSSAPFDRGAAAASLGAIDVSSCKRPDGPVGTGHLRVVFLPSGKAQSAAVDQPPFASTPVGACVAAIFQTHARVPPFGGAPVAVGKSFVVQ